MSKITIVVLIFFVLLLSCNAQEIPPKEDQINAALLAAPQQFRDGATVLGYNNDGKLVTLRQGTNEMIRACRVSSALFRAG